MKRFQARHGLPETGTVGPQTLAELNVPVSARLRQLAASLDRLAATSFTFGQRYVVVNIPAAYAEAVTNGKVDRRYVAVVGKPDRPSPEVTGLITAVNLNPTWTAPLSIVKKDIIPKMRKDPSYVGRMGMRLIDAQGGEIDPKAVDWNSDRAPNFNIRQDSGKSNALGAVRIDMPNAHAVYMHDTPSKNHFSADYRFHSSGCARIADVRDLAAWLLADTGLSRRDIDNCDRDRQTLRHPPAARGAGGLDLSHRLGRPRRQRAFPQGRLRPRRAAGAAAHGRAAARRDGGARIRLRPAIGAAAAAGIQGGLLPRQSVTPTRNARCAKALSA